MKYSVLAIVELSMTTTLYGILGSKIEIGFFYVGG